MNNIYIGLFPINTFNRNELENIDPEVKGGDLFSYVKENLNKKSAKKAVEELDCFFYLIEDFEDACNDELVNLAEYWVKYFIHKGN